MKLVLTLFFLSFITSCATPITESHKCYELGKTKYKYCRDKNTNLIGFIENDEWILPPEYNHFQFYGKSKRLYLRKNGSEIYDQIILGKDKVTTPTEFIRIEMIPYDYKGVMRTVVMAIAKDKSMITLSEVDGQPTKTKDRWIKNVDDNAINEFGASIPPFVWNMARGFWVRHNENGKKFYRYYTEESLEWTGKYKYPAEKVTFFIWDGVLVPFEIIDAEKRFYWPMVKRMSDVVEKPKNVIGVYIDYEYHWVDPKGIERTYPKIPSFEYGYWFVREINGKQYYSILNGFSIRRAETIKEVFNGLVEVSDGVWKYTDPVYLNAYQITDKGVYYIKPTIAFKNPEGFYWLLPDSSSSDKKIASKEEIIAYSKNRDANIDKIAKKVELKNKQDAQEAQAIQAEIAEQVRRDTEALKNKQAAQKAAKRAAIKAQSDAAWRGVSDQIQQKGREAEQKADCIRKRTKKKQDFIDGKQNWYEEGGC